MPLAALRRDRHKSGAFMEHGSDNPGVPASVVVIAISTGGPDALAVVLNALLGSLLAPVLVVQHLPANCSPGLATGLAGQLNQDCRLPVQEAIDGVRLGPRQVWLAPPDKHRVVRASPRGPSLALHRGPLVLGSRPAADPLFLSACEVYGSGVLAVVRGGMAQAQVSLDVLGSAIAARSSRGRAA